MKISELQDIAEKLLDAYGSGRHWEVTAATKEDGCWLITVQEYKEPTESEGAENDSNK
jgi:hypothetical protein